MESNYNYSSSSSSSSTYSKQAPAMLHSVRKPQSKPWRKPAIAPMPPTPPRVYKVDPVNFRDLVQQLTSAPKFQTTHRLRRMAPPPLAIDAVSSDHHHKQPPMPPANQPSANNNVSLEFNLASPLSWCSFPLLSPGILSPLDQTRTSAVL